MKSCSTDSGHDLFAFAAAKFDAVAGGCADRVHVRDIDLAGAHARLRVAGDRLAAHLLETFEHLRIADPPPRPDLRIDVWAADETGEEALGNEAPAEIREMIAIDGGTLAMCAGERHLVNLTGGNTVAWLDRRDDRIVASVRRTGDLLLRERVKPFGTLIAFWLRDRGVRVLHAAAVADGERAVLLPGLSGAGKSTCATLSVEAGLRYLADDAVAMSESAGGVFVAHSLFGGARLWPADLGMLADWSRHAIEPDSAGDEPKTLLFVGRRHARQLARQARIVAVAFPRIVAGADTRLRRMARPEAMRTLVQTALFLGIRPEPADVEQMLRLITHLPTFALELGADRSRIPMRIQECLRADVRAGDGVAG